MFASSQASSTPEQPPCNICGDPNLTLSRSQFDFELLFVRFTSKPARNRKRLKIRSGSGLVRKGGCFKLGVDLAGPNILIIHAFLEGECVRERERTRTRYTGGGVKQGRFVILRFRFFCSVWGPQDAQMLGKTARKVLLSHPLLCAHQVLVETRI